MAEDCSIAAGQHGRHPSPFIADVGVADGVNTAMKAVQAAGPDAIAYPAGGDA